jgi:L-cysteine desulfidase
MTNIDHKFSIYFDTEETSNHTMGAAELGAALISLDRAIEQADKLLNGETSKVDIKVSAPESGSIGIPIAVTIAAGGIDVVQLLGLAGTAGFASKTVLEVISFLKNRKIQSVVRNKNGKSTITVKKGKQEESYELDSNVEKLVTNNSVRDQIYGAFFEPVQNQDNPKILIKDFEGKNILTTLDKEDISTFKKLPRTTLVDKDEVVKKVNVRFIKIDFEKESGWVVDYLGDRLTVKIEDEFFMERNKNNEQGFKSGDLFEVDLKTIITKHPDKPESSRRVISKVHKKRG